MTSTTYQLDSPRWLWELFTQALNAETEYNRYNDRLVEGIAIEVRRFAAADLLELTDQDRRRIETLLSEVATDEETVPLASEGVSLSNLRLEADSPDANPGVQGRENGEQPSLSGTDRGDQRR